MKTSNYLSGNVPENTHLFKAPGRTELAGNHTDHNNGKVLAASINLEITAAVQKTDDHIAIFRCKSFPDTKTALTDSSGSYDLEPKHEEAGATGSLVRGIAAQFYKRGCKIGGFTANAESAVHPGSGLSSSAAVEVLIGRIFNSLYGNDQCSDIEIAKIGQIAENDYFGKPCGLMDQIACASGGAVAIDFDDPCNPIVKKINFNLSAVNYTLCVVNTGGSHADLTADYASIPAEMKAVAAFFGKSVLRELDKETLLSSAACIRKKFGDRHLLRAIHFFDENARVEMMTDILEKLDSAVSDTEKQNFFIEYLNLVNESGCSSYELLQNIYSQNSPVNQGIAAALALTKNFLRCQKLTGACRVHGGGFAGTIQAYIPDDAMNAYITRMESVFGKDCVTPLKI